MCAGRGGSEPARNGAEAGGLRRDPRRATGGGGVWPHVLLVLLAMLVFFSHAIMGASSFSEEGSMNKRATASFAREFREMLEKDGVAALERFDWAERFRELGFEMDCGHSFNERTGLLLGDERGLDCVLESIDDVNLNLNLPRFRLHPYAAFRRRSSSGRLARSNSSGLRYPSAEWVLALL